MTWYVVQIVVVEIQLDQVGQIPESKSVKSVNTAMRQGNVLEMEIVILKVFAAKEIACVYLDILETNVNVSHQ